MTTPSQPFTGRARDRKTRGWARAGDVLARCFITVGGIGTIIAVCLIGAFLVYVIFPLFLPASITDEAHVAAPWPGSSVLHVGVDEDQILGWALLADGSIHVFRLDTGKELEARMLIGGARPTAFAGPDNEGSVLFGFASGTVRLGTIRWQTTFLDAGEVPEKHRQLAAGDWTEYAGGLLIRTPGGEFLTRRLEAQVQDRFARFQGQIGGALAMAPLGPVHLLTLLRPDGEGPQPPFELSSPVASPVRQLDRVALNKKDSRCAILTEDGQLRVYELSRTSKSTFAVDVTAGKPVVLPAGKGLPSHVLLTGVGDQLLVGWKDGQLHRYSIQDLDNPFLAEVITLLEDRGLSLTALQFMIGRATLLAGDSSGRVRAWFGTKPTDASTRDGIIFRAAHDFPGTGSPVTSLGVSARNFMAAVGHADGQVHLFYVTSEKGLGQVQAGDQPVRNVALMPRNDGLLALTAQGIWHWHMDPGHPEATLSSLFLPVWYEGYDKPKQVWQSSTSGASEPKYGLWPCVFGTLKATFYSLLIGVPLALLAAIYTSEFLHPRLKAVVKPTVELMASLPSVVLGFLAALVFAPFIDNVLPTFLATFATVPATLLVGARLWQLLPEKFSLRLARWRILFIFLAIPVGLLLSVLVGPFVEGLLFGGNLKAWLNQQGDSRTYGSAASGWFVILLPLAGVLIALVMGRLVNPWLRRLTARWRRPACALADLAKFLAAAVVAMGLAWLTGLLLTSVGLDPRGSNPGDGILGTYEQRNSLIVGFVMGFAIIPIIYTLAEDALSAVPDHLRSASLGCGATHWQTAVRIIIPTAMSGLFSAVMVGLGRAVGETMIVLMATGSTPIMDFNIFNGFRTLSANIAIEMPEAERDSTHYRVLYLAGFVLFSMTFVLNTVAELVRQRFRKRAYQL